MGPIFNKTLYRDRFRNLLIVLLLYVGMAPFLQDFIRLQLLIDVFISILFISIIIAVSEKKLQLYVLLALFVPVIGSTWWVHFDPDIRVIVFDEISDIFFFGYAFILLLKFVLKQNRVNTDLIYAAVIGYLFIGVIWASAYSLLAHTYPASFSIDLAGATDSRLVFTYFSLVTLTTLGYGDITPLTDRAYAFTILEAVIGQIYLTVLIARLVGLHIAHSTDSRSEK